MPKLAKKFRKLHLEAYALPLLKNRVLSPASRARKILKKTPKLDKMQKITLDSSMEKSLEKVDIDVEGLFSFKNKNDIALYSK